MTLRNLSDSEEPSTPVTGRFGHPQVTPWLQGCKIRQKDNILKMSHRNDGKSHSLILKVIIDHFKNSLTSLS